MRAGHDAQPRAAQSRLAHVAGRGGAVRVLRRILRRRLDLLLVLLSSLPFAIRVAVLRICVCLCTLLLFLLLAIFLALLAAASEQARHLARHRSPTRLPHQLGQRRHTHPPRLLLPHHRVMLTQHLLGIDAVVADGLRRRRLALDEIDEDVWHVAWVCREVDAIQAQKRVEPAHAALVGHARRVGLEGPHGRAHAHLAAAAEVDLGAERGDVCASEHVEPQRVLPRARHQVGPGERHRLLVDVLHLLARRVAGHSERQQQAPLVGGRLVREPVHAVAVLGNVQRGHLGWQRNAAQHVRAVQVDPTQSGRVPLVARPRLAL
mmetsp:Transcript_6579/g.20864  ORF Transcript_6579/g.20864 Transcript_6579/m.20864 type:complete len:320 (+) Transcript_6579:1754-2713(+)